MGRPNLVRGEDGKVACDHCGGGLEKSPGGETRCACGSLLAIVTPQGLEVKCRRCKRTVTLQWSAEDRDETQPHPTQT